jgi:hypothetical protein
VVSNDAVEFYTGTNYSGTNHTYRWGADVNLMPDTLTDRFKSVRIGSGAKAITWDYEGVAGERFELKADSPDITDIGRPTRFMVTKSTTSSLLIGFEDATGAAAGRYSLKADSFLVGSVTVLSGSSPNLRLIGVMDPSGVPVTTALFVRDESSGAYVAVGSVYFVSTGGRIDVSDSSNLPENLEWKRGIGVNTFIFTLTDTE